MSPGRRAALPVSLVFLFVIALAALCPPSLAQNQANPSPQSPSGPQKPTRKPDQVLNTDPVVLLAPRSTNVQSGATAARSATPASSVATSSAPTPTETDRKAAEIASVEKQIQDKSKRIAFLMRLFVNDERPFLEDPDSHKVDSASQDRRKYEQDELLYETAELAKLKSRLNQLTAPIKASAN